MEFLTPPTNVTSTVALIFFLSIEEKIFAEQILVSLDDITSL